jgi:hypothetical protein
MLLHIRGTYYSASGTTTAVTANQETESDRTAGASAWGAEWSESSDDIVLTATPDASVDTKFEVLGLTILEHRD